MFYRRALAASFTFVIPLPGIIPGLLTAETFGATTYGNACWLALLFWLLTFLAVSILYLRGTKKITCRGKPLSFISVFMFMWLMYFIVNPLFFYIAAIGSNSRGDGQLVFGGQETSRYASIAFICMGALIDIVKKKQLTPAKTLFPCKQLLRHRALPPCLPRHKFTCEKTGDSFIFIPYFMSETKKKNVFAVKKDLNDAD